jgi:hypothetical protein
MIRRLMSRAVRFVAIWNFCMLMRLMQTVCRDPQATGQSLLPITHPKPNLSKKMIASLAI